MTAAHCAPDPCRPPGVPRPRALRVFDLSVGEMLWSRRTIFMGLVVGAPVFIALLLRVAGRPRRTAPRGHGHQPDGHPDDRPVDFRPDDLGLLSALHRAGAGGVLRHVADGRRDRGQDHYLSVYAADPARRGPARQVPRLPGCTVFVVLPSVVLVYLLVVPMQGTLGGSFIDLVKDLALLALGLAVYGALFAFVGAKFKRPLLIGLIFIFGWEQAALAFPGLPETVHDRLLPAGPRAARHAERQRPQPGPGHLPGEPVSRQQPRLAGRLIAFVGFLAWSPWTVERREYVLEQ